MQVGLDITRMTPALQLQGRLFCGLSMALAIASLAGARLDSQQELLAAGALVLLLGVPHGAFDVVLAPKLFVVAGLRGWTVFSLLYVGLSALVVGFWLVAPTLFLCIFLIFAALHFGGDPAAGVSRLSRGLYGGAVIVLPALLHAAELQQLLGFVAGPESAAVVMPALRLLAAPWLCATVLAGALLARTSPLAAGEWAALAAVSVAAPPLIAFTVYFCAMHSPRHILRTLANLHGTEARHALTMAFWPTVVVLAAAALVATMATNLPLETRVIQLVFVGLAALTLPHMVLIERARRVSAPAEPRRPTNS